jgi:hypothetical protein
MKLKENDTIPGAELFVLEVEIQLKKILKNY